MATRSEVKENLAEQGARSIAELVIDRGVDLVLDVGANRGQTGEVLRGAGFQGRIVSFEPLPAPFSQLWWVSKWDPGWECRRFALGAREGESLLHVAGNESMSSSFLPMGKRQLDAAPESEYVGEEPVRMTTLDRLAPQLFSRRFGRVCLKLDTQGYELEVLRGGQASLPRLAFVWAEVSLVPLYEGQPLYHDISAFMEENGFDSVAEEPIWIDEETGEPLQLDVLWTNRDSSAAADSEPGLRTRVGLGVMRARRSTFELYQRTPLARLLRPRVTTLPFEQHKPQPFTVPRRYLRTRLPKSAPTISVVTPSLNQGPFLERTIRSVLSQGYPRLEYIVQDGASTDSTADVLASYQHLISHCESCPDEGHSHAINLGMSHATGEILAFLNSDDLLLPGALNFIARFFSQHPEVGLVHGDRIVIDENDRRVGAWVMPAHDRKVLPLVDFVAQETMFWRRSAWERAGGRMNEGFAHSLDWELLLRMDEAGVRMAHVKRFLGAFRVHRDQKHRRLNSNAEAEDMMLRQHYLGRRLSWPEAVDEVKPFLRRHTARHTIHRIGQRLPLPQLEVDLRAEALELKPALGAPASRG